MKPILFILLTLQLSVYAQKSSEDYVEKKKLYFTLINSNGKIDNGGANQMTRNEIIDAQITLKGKEDNEAVPKIKELIIYMTGYPEIIIEGGEIDRETASKIEKAKAGDVIVIKPRTEIPSYITTRQIEIIE
jgi:hypothetical protein